MNNHHSGKAQFLSVGSNASKVSHNNPDNID